MSEGPGTDGTHKPNRTVRIKVLYRPADCPHFWGSPYLCDSQDRRIFDGLMSNPTVRGFVVEPVTL